MRTFTTRHARGIRTGAGLAVATAGVLTLAACGSGGGAYGGGSSSGSASLASSQSGSGMTVTVHDAGGTRVLATSSGLTLYSSAQENGKVLCTSGACHAVWAPLTVPSGQKPTAPKDVAKGLSTLPAGNGTQQVTFDGQPLYTFSYDKSPGQDNGNGQTDSFDGTSFTWHAVTASGAATTTGASSGSSNGSAHGYGY